MLAPLSWLKEYVDIALEPSKLGEKLTEVGLGTEKITKLGDDIIFEFEITPNRPDLLSIIGIAREIAAVEGKNIKHPKDVNIRPKEIKKTFPLEIQTDFSINPRFTGIIIDGIKVKESPDWLKERLVKIGQRPINNIVDITNYVMFELGNPLHAFDLGKIKGGVMRVHKTKGGEKFTSVDGITYHLPKGAVVISDREGIIDLCGIKGGLNSGTFEETKTIFIRVPAENPALIRRASQSLGIRSEASSIFERGVNAGGTIEALKRCVNLILEIAGGEIASELYDLKKDNFSPRKANLNLQRLDKMLGISIPEQEVISILKRLNLSPRKISKSAVQVTISTYRNDLKIEEDIIEEIARLYGYNRFPKTLPDGQIPIKPVPYFKDYKTDEKVKNFLAAGGFSEIYTYSLVSEEDLSSFNIDPGRVLRIDNPVSREFEYLRPTLKINLLKALVQNRKNFEKINLFELGKVYLGPTLDGAREEYRLSGISNTKSFYEIKGTLERLFKDLNVDGEEGFTIEVMDDGIIFELNYSNLLNKAKPYKTFRPIPKYPPVIEDLSLEINQKIKYKDIIDIIREQSGLIKDISLIDTYKNRMTLRIAYQSTQKNLTNEEVGKIREKIYRTLKTQLKVEIL